MAGDNDASRPCRPLQPRYHARVRADELRVALGLHALLLAEEVVDSGDGGGGGCVSGTAPGPQHPAPRPQQQYHHPQQPAIAEFEDDYIDSATAGHVWPMGRLALWVLQLPELQQHIRGRRVLELGSGTGIGGISAALAGAARVTLTDRAPALALIRQNVAANEEALVVVVVPGSSGEGGGVGRAAGVAAPPPPRVSVRELEWLAPTDVTTLPPFDTLLAVDVLYNEQVQDAFVKKLCELWPRSGGSGGAAAAAGRAGAGSWRRGGEDTQDGAEDNDAGDIDAAAVAAQEGRRPRQLLLLQLTRCDTLAARGMQALRAAGFHVAEVTLTAAVHRHAPSFADDFGGDTRVFWARVTRVEGVVGHGRGECGVGSGGV